MTRSASRTAHAAQRSGLDVDDAAGPQLDLEAIERLIETYVRAVGFPRRSAIQLWLSRYVSDYGTADRRARGRMTRALERRLRRRDVTR